MSVTLFGKVPTQAQLEAAVRDLSVDFTVADNDYRAKDKAHDVTREAFYAASRRKDDIKRKLEAAEQELIKFIKEKKI